VRFLLRGCNSQHEQDCDGNGNGNESRLHRWLLVKRRQRHYTVARRKVKAAAFTVVVQFEVRRHPEWSRFSGGAKDLARLATALKGKLHHYRQGLDSCDPLTAADSHKDEPPEERGELNYAAARTRVDDYDGCGPGR